MKYNLKQVGSAAKVTLAPNMRNPLHKNSDVIFLIPAFLQTNCQTLKLDGIKAKLVSNWEQKMLFTSRVTNFL